MPRLPPPRTLSSLPDELLHHMLWHLDVPDLLSISRTSHRLRRLALDPHLHTRRLRLSSGRLTAFLPSRPALSSLAPPRSAIYLSRTAQAARRLSWDLTCIRLGRKLSRRPCAANLVGWNILPAECRAGGGGLVVQRKRRVEREMVKEGLRVWLERKAREIAGKKEGVVGVLVWRFSRWMKREEGSKREVLVLEGGEGRVLGLKKFWEGMGGRALEGV